MRNGFTSDDIARRRLVADGAGERDSTGEFGRGFGLEREAKR